MRRYFAISVALLVPCFWLPRIEAGDLSSHTYNAWLAQLIGRGEAPGLTIEPLWTNTLFDLLLSALWRFGPAVAQKIAVSAAVLIFFWGAFAFVGCQARRQPWFLAPILAALSYGWVFHAGFFNFYVSLGLSFWALSLARPLLVLAYLAHPLPVLWAAGVMTYRAASRALRPRYRWLLVAAAMLIVTLLRRLLESRFETMWYRQQIGSITGADQLFVYGRKFQFLFLVLLGVWAILLLQLLRRHGWRSLMISEPLHLALATAAAIAILPGRILLPSYGHALGFIAERMSLAIAVCACAVAARVRLRPAGNGLIGALAASFFVCLFVEEQAVNGIENRLDRAVAQLPPGARAISSLSEPDYRVDPLIHLIDRACIGRCFSYANYEPSTRQFRVRAAPGNPVVVASYADSYALQTGKYKVKQSDLPLWGIFAEKGSKEFSVRRMKGSEFLQMAGLLGN